MDYRQYYAHSFSFDVSSMQLQPGSPFTRYLLLNDAHAAFFGGRQWQDMEKDLEKIAPANKLDFVLNLFFMVLTGYTLQKRFPETYQVYRSLTRFPLFGEETEDDVYLEHPAWLLARPIMAGLFHESLLFRELEGSLVRFKADYMLFSATYLESLPFDTLVSAYCSCRPEQPEIQALSARLEAMLKHPG